MNNKRGITAILLGVGLLLVVGCVLTGAFVWMALTTASSEPEIVDTRVLDGSFAAEAYVSGEYADVVFVEGVFWEQAPTPDFRIGFDYIKTPQQSLYFRVLLRNTGHEPVEVRRVEAVLLDANGQEDDAAASSFRDPQLLFPGGTRIVTSGIRFPEDLAQPVPWVEGVIEVNVITPWRNSLCKVIHWPASRVLVESSGYNENGEYVLEGEVVDIRPPEDVMAIGPRLQISLFNEQGKLVAWKYSRLDEDNEFRLSYEPSDPTRQIASYEIHFVEVVRPTCPW